jgi:hypothetical protein
MKTTSLILNILKGLKDQLAEHSSLDTAEAFEAIEAGFKSHVEKALAKEYATGNAYSKLKDIYDAQAEIDEAISDLYTRSEEGSEKSEASKLVKKEITKLNTLLGSTTEVKFYSLEKSLRTKIYNAVEALDEALDTFNSDSLVDQIYALQDIKESFETQKEKDFEPDEEELKTLDDLRNVINAIKLG